MAKSKKKKAAYVCAIPGKKNYGLIKECNFRFMFDEGFTYHCPICGAPLSQEKKELDRSKTN